MYYGITNDKNSVLTIGSLVRTKIDYSAFLKCGATKLFCGTTFLDPRASEFARDKDVLI